MSLEDHHTNPTATFDLEAVHTYFGQSLNDELGTVDQQKYCEAWHELNKFLDTLGTLFHFVTHDVKSKVAIIEEYMNADKEHYETVNKMLEYEVQNNLTKTKKPSGSRTLLRLHRALNFVIAFFDELVAAPLNAKCSKIAHDSYEKTLSSYHAWIVRKAAGLAMYSLPHKDVLLHRMIEASGTTYTEKGDLSDMAAMTPEEKTHKQEQNVAQILKKISDTARPLYEKVEELYKKDNLLDLP